MERSRYLIPTAEQPRVRRAADVTGVVIGVVVFLWSLRAYNRVGDTEFAMADLIQWIPDWVSGTLSVLYTVVALYVVGLFVAVLTQWRQRLDAVRDMVLASIATGLLVTLIVRLVTDTWPLVLVELGRAEPISQFPITRVAMVTATLLVVAPHLTRPMRRVGWLAILLAAIAGVGLGYGLPSSAIGAIGIGAAGAGVMLLVFGSPRGYPDTASISEALRVMGVDVSNVRLDEDQSWGVRRLVGDSPQLGQVEIKAYGRDATDSQLFARVWRYLWFRDTTPSLALTRMQSVEHEALVTMMAQKTGAAVPEVLAAGLGGDDMAILAVDRSGRRLSDMDPDQVTDEQLVSVWDSLARLHRARIAHGALTCEVIAIDGDNHEIGDFASGTLAAPESALAVDVVGLLVSMSHRFGVERSVDAARRALGEQRLGEALPYIQVPAVSASERRRLDKPKDLVSEVHDEVRNATGADVEETVQIRRVQVKNLLMTAVTLFAVYFLVTQLAGIDFAAVWAVLEGAVWAWIVVGFIVGQLVYLPEATAMLAAVGRPIPMKPAVILQSAMKFISLAVPSTAGRIAMTAAFLRKYGVSFTASLVQGSIDTISGLAVEIVILVLAFVSGTLSLGLDTGETEWGLIIMVVASIGLLVVLLVRRVQRLRDWVMPIFGEALGALGGVLKDPKRTLALLASNFAARFVFAFSMWFILVSLDVSLGIWSVLTATVATGLLGGVVPVPGGVGISEAVLTAFLVLFGVDETTAFAAAVIYRVATFYIPSGVGFFSMRWLEKNGHI